MLESMEFSVDITDHQRIFTRRFQLLLMGNAFNLLILQICLISWWPFVTENTMKLCYRYEH